PQQAADSQARLVDTPAGLLASSLRNQDRVAPDNTCRGGAGVSVPPECGVPSPLLLASAMGVPRLSPAPGCDWLAPAAASAHPHTPDPWASYTRPTPPKPGPPR